MNINNKNIIMLNFSKCNYLGEIHKELKEKFGFPEYYGENWSALWDCIDGLFDGCTEFVIFINGFTSLPKDLRQECEKMLEIFDEVNNQSPNVVFKLTD